MMSDTKDPLVIFTPSGKRGRFATGTPVLQAARELGVDLDSVCGGRGICSKCQVQPSYGEFPKHGVTVVSDALSDWNAVEERYKSKRGMIEGRRLGCQAKIHGDVVIDVPPESQVHKQVVRKRAEAREIVMDPATRLFYVEVAEPDMHNPKGDLERLLDALWEQWGLANIIGDLRTLQMLQPALREGEWKVTAAIYTGRGRSDGRIVQVWPGFYEGTIYGVAFDVGSTTIACHLCDLATGEVKASAGLMNPQIRFGEDLMSRVSYSMMNPGGAAEMTQGGARGDQCADRPSRRRGADRPHRHCRGRAWSAIRSCTTCSSGLDPKGAGLGALCAGHIGQPDALGARDRAWPCTPMRGSISCPASPGMWAPMRRRWHCPRRRTARTR